MPENYTHIFLSGNVKAEKYKAAQTIGTPLRIPKRDRVEHSTKLLQQLNAIWIQKEQIKQIRAAEKIVTREGTYLSFTSSADYDLVLNSIENFKKGIRLLNVKEEKINEDKSQIKATVYIPTGMEGFFISKIEKYQKENSKTGKPKNASLVDSINDISIALLESLWTDKISLIPDNTSKWCEVWLNINTKDYLEEEQIQQFYKTLQKIGIDYKENVIIFPERVVLLINSNRDQLIELMLQSDILAEFRAAQEPAGFWVNESAIDQQIWVDDLLQRIEIVNSNVKVCILDSGVNNGHQLLRPLLEDDDNLTVDQRWGTYDHYEKSGHGTLMAGIAAYGNLEQILLSTSKIPISHKVCSVKILPPPQIAGTPKELWGNVTEQGIYRAEIQNPDIVLIYCLSVTSKQDSDQGKPSSWSGCIDKLAFGNGTDQRLILISAGNIRDDELWRNYPESNFVSTIENPAQSWNSLVIGAYTEKTKVNDSKFANYTLLANHGELSPFSSTSLVWEKKWPIKPDVVFEGGNLLMAADKSIAMHEDLEILSTSKRFTTKLFDTLNATSASTAQGSWFAAKIAFEYPNAWPQTIRALIVHSANWNSAMLNQLNVKPNNKGDKKKLLRVFGYGIPNLSKALYSQENALTFIAQEIIQPFRFKMGSKTEVETNELHFFNLPWPKEILLDLGNNSVKLRVTLSYFIDPGAGEIGWKDRYRYQSHGLRFDINNISEGEDEFRKRVNFAAREKNEEINSNSGSNRWAIGLKNRSSGSIHSDYWEGTAAELATCNLIAVYPIIGWWRERKHLGRVENKSRYALIISLETPEENVKLYTTVKNLIEVPIEVKVNK